MNESTTKQLENILSNIDSEKQMEEYMEMPMFIMMLGSDLSYI